MMSANSSSGAGRSSRGNRPVSIDSGPSNMPNSSMPNSSVLRGRPTVNAGPSTARDTRSPQQGPPIPPNPGGMSNPPNYFPPNSNSPNMNSGPLMMEGSSPNMPQSSPMMGGMNNSMSRNSPMMGGMNNPMLRNNSMSRNSPMMGGFRRAYGGAYGGG